MYFFLLGLSLLLLIMYLGNRARKAKKTGSLLYSFRWFFVGGIILLVIYLAATGKIQMIWLALLSFLPWIRRFLVMRSLYRQARNTRDSKKAYSAHNQKNNTTDHDKQSNPEPEPVTKADAYKVLELSPGASREEIYSAYRRLMKKHHPDAGGDANAAARINRAKDILLS